MKLHGLQERTRALLAELAPVSIDEQLGALARRARIWQDTRNFRAERKALLDGKSKKKEARDKTDERRYIARCADGLGPRNSGSDSSQDREPEQQHQTETESEAEEVPAELIFDTIRETTPPDSVICKTAPSLNDSLVGYTIAFRWNVGWEQGRVANFLPAERKLKKRKTKSDKDVPCANFEVKFPSDDGLREVQLKPELYVTRNSRVESSWTCFESRP
jgi:hypothetical protein